ncbi:MAG: 16S rRNA (cytidine(1402)-2'-O)-methyltransferase [Oscillospiraceae bacterium]|nr:16S rRNA (cytidine(1402)-2'-O)-methyltransferase [Oscillospiraceae bacterium]
MPTLYVVATPIGNLSDMTPRALQTLGEVSLIAAEDTRRTRPLLTHFGISTPLVSYHKHNEQGRAAELVARMSAENIDIALVSDAGTPCISDPGSVFVAAARTAGIAVVPIPGACSVVAALSVCGFSATEFTFVGFLPKGGKELAKCTEKIALRGGIHVIFASSHRIKDTTSLLAKEFPTSELFAINDITKLHELAFYGTTAEVAQSVSANEKAGLGEYTLVLNTPQSKPTAEEKIAPEALILNEMVQSGCDIRTAAAVVEKHGHASRNELYKASLRLKEMLNL